ncbi:MAG: hypothetical protein FJ090_09395 [Deltaproteobacteria bacterium]|nr:hypothetical protein [Deltaproteobacteria bacterium]
MIPWDRREPAHAVALVRVAFGLAIAGHLGRMWATGAWRWIWQGTADGGLVSLLHTPIGWIGGPTPGNVEAVMALGIASGLCFALGLLTPLANLALAWSWAALTGLGPNAGGSYDYLGGAVLWVLLFSGCGGAWSIDAAIRVRLGRPPAEAYAAARWLLCWQLVVMYDSTAWHKLSSGWVPWGSLDVLWYVLQQPTWHRFEMSWLAPLYPLTQLGTLMTWCFEHSSPLLVLAAWFRHTRARAGWLRAQFNRVDFRLPFLAFGLVLHVLIEVTLEVGSFSLFTLGLYAACFSGEELRRALTRRRPA